MLNGTDFYSVTACIDGELRYKSFHSLAYPVVVILSSKCFLVMMCFWNK